jgi:hypothetical protein
VLAAVYLAWLSSTLLFQRGYHYAHVPETLLMLAVFAANRWPVPFVLVVLQVVVGVVLAGGPVHEALRERSRFYRRHTEPNPAFDPDRLRWWGGCFDRDPPRELRKGVGLWTDHFGGHDPVQLGAVADFLRRQGVRDGELIAWHDSPHALYADLGVRPGFRFMHVGTVWALGPGQRDRVREELRAALPRARFVVSDLHRVTARYADLAAGADVVPAWQWDEFPFDRPVVFRSPGGRYWVHRAEGPVTGCEIPARLDQAGPNPWR